MKDELIPGDNNVSRLCSGGKINPSDGSPSPAAFLPRPEEEYVSVNWLEFFEGFSRASRLEEIRCALSRKMSVRASARLGILNVGVAQARVASDVGHDVSVEFRHRPDEPKPDPSHSGIFFEQGEAKLAIATALADAVESMEPAISS